jgi:IS5 family transposase
VHRQGQGHRPYEFGVTVSVATKVQRSKGGQFVAHVATLPGNPYDGYTLAEIIPDIEALVGNTLERILADAGYRGQTPRPIAGSGPIRPARSGASHRRSNAR